VSLRLNREEQILHFDLSSMSREAMPVDEAFTQKFL